MIPLPTYYCDITHLLQTITGYRAHLCRANYIYSFSASERYKWLSTSLDIIVNHIISRYFVVLICKTLPACLFLIKSRVSTMHMKHNLFPHSWRVQIIPLPSWQKISLKKNKQKGANSRILRGISEEQSFWSGIDKESKFLQFLYAAKILFSCFYTGIKLQINTLAPTALFLLGVI